MRCLLRNAQRLGELLADTRARHAGSDVSAAPMAATLLGSETTALLIEGDACACPDRFRAQRTAQGGGSDDGPKGNPAPAPAPVPQPPVLDRTFVAPYDLSPNTTIWANGVTVQQLDASATPATGRCMVNAWGFGVIVTGGGSVCRALVGLSFTVPAQFTQLDISADVSIDADILAIAVLGVAGGGLDCGTFSLGFANVRSTRLVARYGSPIVDRRQAVRQHGRRRVQILVLGTGVSRGFSRVAGSRPTRAPARRPGARWCACGTARCGPEGWW